MILPTGVTGFWQNGIQPPTASNVKGFVSACHEAARRLGGNVIASEEPYSRKTNNFAVVIVVFPRQRVAALLNAHYPIVGFAEPIPVHEQEIRFADAPSLREQLLSSGVYQVLSREALETAVTPAAARELADGEVEQIRYWKPRRVGDIIFNFWD
jgi:hypothetical protein